MTAPFTKRRDLVGRAIGPGKATPRSRTNAAGRELMAAMKQAHDAVMSGDPFRGMTVRVVEVPDPRAYSVADVKAIRGELGVSVALFARLMGVSAKLVEHWEQGRRTPAPLACRLLEHVSADPAAFLRSLVKRRKLPTSKAMTGK